MWLLVNIIMCSIPMVLMYKKIKKKKHWFAEMLFHSGWIVPPITWITIWIYEEYIAEPTGGLELIDSALGIAIMTIIFELCMLIIMPFVLIFLSFNDNKSDEKNDRS